MTYLATKYYKLISKGNQTTQNYKTSGRLGIGSI
jgi:hypothetical protein